MSNRALKCLNVNIATTNNTSDGAFGKNSDVVVNCIDDSTCFVHGDGIDNGNDNGKEVDASSADKSSSIDVKDDVNVNANESILEPALVLLVSKEEEENPTKKQRCESPLFIFHKKDFNEDDNEDGDVDSMLMPPPMRRQQQTNNNNHHHHYHHKDDDHGQRSRRSGSFRRGRSNAIDLTTSYSTATHDDVLHSSRCTLTDNPDMLHTDEGYCPAGRDNHNHDIASDQLPQNPFTDHTDCSNVTVDVAPVAIEAPSFHSSQHMNMLGYKEYNQEQRYDQQHDQTGNADGFHAAPLSPHANGHNLGHVNDPICSNGDIISVVDDLDLAVDCIHDNSSDDGNSDGGNGNGNSNSNCNASHALSRDISNRDAHDQGDHGNDAQTLTQDETNVDEDAIILCSSPCQEANSQNGNQNHLPHHHQHQHQHDDIEDDGEQSAHPSSSHHPSPQHYDKPSITTRFSDIIGHAAAKLRLEEMLLPLSLPQSISNQILIGIRAAPASMLLYGPPGTGKTKLAKAVAGEAGAAFFTVGPSTVLSKFVGESEASIKKLFERAKLMAGRVESRCCVVFFDEIDALGVSRGDGGGTGGGGEDSSSGHGGRRILAELLIQLTQLADEAQVVDEGEGGGNGCGCHSDCGLDSDSGSGATLDGNEILNEDENGDDNREERMDDVQGQNEHGSCTEGNNVHCDGRDMREDRPHAISESSIHSNERSSSCHKPRVIVIAATNRPEDCDPALLRRFSIRVLVGLPSHRDRRRILSRLLEEIENTITPADLKDLAVATEGWSGSDLESVAREAVMAPIRECIRSAAVLKMKARKAALGRKKQTASNDSNENDAARDELLNQFSKLRPVTMQDFQEAISFWIGDGQEDMTAQMMNQAVACHYDSESSFDDDE